MEFVDYYQVIGVKPDASATDIKREYRKLARKYHPDVSDVEDAESHFKEIGEAYAVLKDSDRRAEYDQLRELHTRGVAAGPDHSDGGFRPPPDWQKGFSTGQSDGSGYTSNGEHWSSGDTEDFSDFFREIFAERARGGDRGQASTKGDDIHSRISISLQAAFDGQKLPLNLRQPVKQADGTVQFEDKTLLVSVPVGVISGQRIRLRGQGAPGFGGAAKGDLYIEIDIVDDPRFAVNGRDVTLVLPVTPWEAALGTTISVETLAGYVRLNVPAGSNGGTRLRLKGRGLRGTPPGDQFVMLRVDLPQAETAEQRALYEKMKNLWPMHDPRSATGEGA